MNIAVGFFSFYIGCFIGVSCLNCEYDIKVVQSKVSILPIIKISCIGICL